jgi:hypothetical protein
VTVSVIATVDIYNPVVAAIDLIVSVATSIITLDSVHKLSMIPDNYTEVALNSLKIEHS